METAHKMKNQKKCIICGQLFDCPPSDKKVTCSQECRKEYAKIRSAGRKFSDESRKRMSDTAKGRKMSDLQKNATEAAQKSPNSGRFETNINAKTWRLISPEGKIYICRNLKLWVRNHCELFGMENTEDNAHRIASGLRQAKRGKIAVTYKGWRAEIITEKSPGE